ncbi:MAG: hypothetical protein U5L96_02750 [Owenweeksia sp.]|nr:hypothetical protein [Owenweeksia sp.]
MDIQAEKLHLIQWITQLRDEKTIARIKALRTNTDTGDKDEVVAYTAGGETFDPGSLDARLKKRPRKISAQGVLLTRQTWKGKLKPGDG